MNSKEKLAKKLGITVEELENRIKKNKEAEEDLIESTAKKKNKSQLSSFYFHSIFCNKIIYKIISNLVTDWEDTDAFKHGIIDSIGYIFNKAAYISGQIIRIDGGQSPFPIQSKSLWNSVTNYH